MKRVSAQKGGPPENLPKKRLVVVALGMFFLFSLLIAHYFKIQILECEKWMKEALGQHEFIVKEPFKRGAFYSNTTIKKGHPETPQPFVIDTSPNFICI